MRIISQDKTIDVSYENVYIASADNVTENVKVFAYPNCSSEYLTRIILGAYKTNERSLEVLSEIRDHYESLKESEFLGADDAFYVSPYFEMPQE